MGKGLAMSKFESQARAKGLVLRKADDGGFGLRRQPRDSNIP